MACMGNCTHQHLCIHRHKHRQIGCVFADLKKAVESLLVICDFINTHSCVYNDCAPLSLNKILSRFLIFTYFIIENFRQCVLFIFSSIFPNLPSSTSSLSSQPHIPPFFFQGRNKKHTTKYNSAVLVLPLDLGVPIGTWLTHQDPHTVSCPLLSKTQ